MSDISFSQLVNGLEKHTDDQWNGHIYQNWMQGRTTYGGLSAALCLAAVQKEFSDLPPLRSAQVNFIGPVGGDISIEVAVMRRGKSVAYISASMTGEKGLATHAVFCFGIARDSRLNQVFDTPINDLNDIPAPEQISSSTDQAQYLPKTLTACLLRAAFLFLARTSSNITFGCVTKTSKQMI